MLSFLYAECHNVEDYFAKHRVMLSVICAECHYPKCHYSEHFSAVCH
jgi:hypothetical protein